MRSRVPGADERHAARRRRDDRLLGAHADEAVDRRDQVARLGELVADGLLGLGDVGDDDRRLRPEADAHRLAVGVEEGRHPGGAESGDQRRVLVGLGAGRQRAGDDAELGPAGEVEEALGEAFEVGRGRRSARAR